MKIIFNSVKKRGYVASISIEYWLLVHYFKNDRNLLIDHTKSSKNYAICIYFDEMKCQFDLERVQMILLGHFHRLIEHASSFRLSIRFVTILHRRDTVWCSSWKFSRLKKKMSNRNIRVSLMVIWRSNRTFVFKLDSLYVDEVSENSFSFGWLNRTKVLLK